MEAGVSYYNGSVRQGSENVYTMEGKACHIRMREILIKS